MLTAYRVFDDDPNGVEAPDGNYRVMRRAKGCLRSWDLRPETVVFYDNRYQVTFWCRPLNRRFVLSLPRHGALFTARAFRDAVEEACHKAYSGTDAAGAYIRAKLREPSYGAMLFIPGEYAKWEAGRAKRQRAVDDEHARYVAANVKALRPIFEAYRVTI